MAAKDKDTIYIDIDDEITGIIDKLSASEGKVVALVLPKRAAAFQSIVNMKLLKRAADSAQKNLVLITSEAGLLPLAGAAGIHIAKTLTSKPEIPLAPPSIDDAEEMVQEDATPRAEPLADRSKSVGELAGAGAGAAAAAKKPPIDNGVETLTLDDDELPAASGPAAAVKSVKPSASKTFEPPAGGAKKNKKLRVPNFQRFRLLIIIGGLILVLIIIGFIFAAIDLPKATITVQTNATNVPTNLNLTLSTSASTVDSNTNTVPAKLASIQKTYTEQVPTTGQKNEGNKASGTVTMTDGQCSGNVPSDLPAGSGLSANSQTYITQADVSFVPTVSHGRCTFEGVVNSSDNGNGESNIPIMAQSGGSSFNVSGVPFTVSGRSDISASGSTSGGTDDIVQTVNQNDINSAKAKISTSNSQQQALETQLKGDNYYPIAATYSTGTPNVTTSADVGDAANNVTVTETITYTMFGAPESDLNSLIDDQVDTQIDTGKQSVLDTGLSQATFNVNSQSSSNAQLSMSTTAVAGPQLNVDGIKQQAAGQKSGPIENQLENNPNVTNVNVKLSPFWVSTIPKKTSRITVIIAKPAANAKTSNSSGNSP